MMHLVNSLMPCAQLNILRKSCNFLINCKQTVKQLLLMMFAIFIRKMQTKHASQFRRIYWFLPCFIITVKNLMTTFDAGLMSTCLLPLRSALTMLLRQSFKTLILTMMIPYNGFEKKYDTLLVYP